MCKKCDRSIKRSPDAEQRAYRNFLDKEKELRRIARENRPPRPPRQPYVFSGVALEKKKAWDKWYRSPEGPGWMAQKIRKWARRGEKAAANYGIGEWRHALAMFNGRCAYCAADGKMTMDHFIPLSRGGRTHRSNIVPACFFCNQSKHNRHPQDWLLPIQYEQISAMLSVFNI